MNQRPIEDILADAREAYGVFGKAERALTLIDRALRMEPENVEALNLKAAVLYELDKDEEAEELHQRALAIEPNSVEALHGLTSIANDRHDYTQALQWAEQAFAAIPNDTYPEFRENDDYRQRLIAELYNEKAFALWYLGEEDEAVRLLTEEGPAACPLEVERMEDQMEWLEYNPDSPGE